MWPDEIINTIEQLELYLPNFLKTAIDVGSEGEEYRTQRQPWMQGFYNYLSQRKIKISTMDLDPKTKADYIHDITQNTKKVGKFDIVFATHLLEHVPWNKFNNVITNLEQMVKKEGFLWVSVPNKYPYHERPIDNNWRPTSEELVIPFNGEILYSSTIEVEHTLPQYFGNPKNRVSCALLKY